MTDRRVGWVALLGLGLAVAAGPAYLLTMDVPWLRSTGAHTTALMVAGTGLGVWAVSRDRRRRVRAAAALTVLLAVLWVVGFLWVAALPAAPDAAALTTAPPIALADHDGGTFELSAALERGPVLLVFYRGHW